MGGIPGPEIILSKKKYILGQECKKNLEYACRRRRARVTAPVPPPRRADTRPASISPPPKPLRPRLAVLQRARAQRSP